MSEPYSTTLTPAQRKQRLADARQWRIDNKPYFDAIYGEEFPEAERAPEDFDALRVQILDRLLAGAQTNMRHALILLALGLLIFIASVCQIAVLS